MKTNEKNILLGVTASISAYRACDLVKDLKADGFSVQVVMTKDSQHFITPLTMQSLSGHEVIWDFFSIGGRVKPTHIELAKQSDLILVYPATADAIAKLAYGFADDVLTCTVLASTAPLVITPAMNTKMYENKFTKENIKRLVSNGAVIIPPVHGRLVCGGEGIGHIAENKTILQTIRRCLKMK
ncbi:MAG: hypothetical protein AUJ72_04835 [Candidatus Omnitrophica bacterium CG1_02_46_14]|nr:MAG: hypothetical protein AUJ72_04835 [Candidatus Omnitrophica bacterium CG1_02_46_14]